MVGRRRDGGRHRQAPQPLQPLHGPIPKITRGERGGCYAASTVIRGPTPRDTFDHGDVHGVLAGQIEVTNDDHQLAGDAVGRVSRIPKAFQMVEELTPFFRETTFALTR